MFGKHHYTLVVQKKQQELEERRLAFNIKRRREFYLKLKTWGEFFNLWSFFVMGALLVLCGGIVIGLNIPELIACNHTTLPICDLLRIRKN